MQHFAESITLPKEKPGSIQIERKTADSFEIKFIDDDGKEVWCHDTLFVEVGGTINIGGVNFKTKPNSI
jgi:hypothetical protein